MLTVGIGSCPEAFGAALQLADFGLSRVMETNATHISTNTIGTIAYQPEEVGTGIVMCHALCTLSISRPIFLFTPHSHLPKMIPAEIARADVFMAISTANSGRYCSTCTPVRQVLKEGKVTPASDVYSFAILMYELYTCKHLFKGMLHSQVSKFHTPC
jgi:serine/threonine protein kinase